MKSFRLHTESKAGIIQDIIGFIVGMGLFYVLHFLHIADTVWRMLAVLMGAILVSYLFRGRVCVVVRKRYPNARWIGLLAVGLFVASFGVIARFVVPGAEEGFMLAFILPAGACIATFVIINRRDPDVTR